jgi:hypothetical protein
MTTAIVTITCPWCSGRVEGVRATNVDQTVNCPYCRTELHIPRVGEVVHERVIIREVAPAPEPDLNCMPSRRKNPMASAIAGSLGFVVLLAMLCTQHHDADLAIENIETHDRAADACRQRCDDSCASAGDKESGKDPYDAETERVMKDADVMLCIADCQRDHDCIGISPNEQQMLHH